MMLDDRSERFLRLLEPQQATLWRFVRSMVRTHHEAEDVVSETILQALEGFHRLRDEQAFVSFLFTIASRIVKRQRWRRRLFGEYDEPSIEQRHHADPLPDVQADIDLLRTALQKLPVKTREAIVMFELTGFSLEEIRTVQGGSLSGVKSRLVRGRQQLARLLDADPRREELPTTDATERQSLPLVHHQTVL
ncbi:MAG: RNA polymerase sigma factor [Ignavibacteriae bacterium]|nr:MAG: RNA polymerase sigma factor [Ignavibacteriota bacterium]